MAYARFGDDSDVYVYLSEHEGGRRGYECCRCTLHGEPPEWPAFGSTAEVIAHIESHEAAGQRVPEGTIDELRKDGDDNDAWIAQRGS